MTAWPIDPLSIKQQFYAKCAQCHLLVELNRSYEDAPEVLAKYVHLDRGDDADEELAGSHNAEPSDQVATLPTWKKIGPPAMRERFAADKGA